ncbi:hypothetical protein F2Q69_00018321 [Brassica cretica]|uniref:Uncharacterized protein n=1 Tax=Brassica cretica TaxID=69181 RepID=A0A8S9Q2K2_BRACR|nr:hypothetical protein F2Q69_00018321 [Brassica cretica]
MGEVWFTSKGQTFLGGNKEDRRWKELDLSFRDDATTARSEEQGQNVVNLCEIPVKSDG